MSFQIIPEDAIPAQNSNRNRDVAEGQAMHLYLSDRNSACLALGSGGPIGRFIVAPITAKDEVDALHRKTCCDNCG